MRVLLGSFYRARMTDLRVDLYTEDIVFSEVSTLIP